MFGRCQGHLCDAFEEYLARVTESVTTNLKQTNRVDVFGTKNEKAIDDVIAESMEQDASKWIWDTNEKMVKYTITGAVNSIKIFTLSDGYYKSSINFTLVVTDNNTKDVIAQQEFSSEKKQLLFLIPCKFDLLSLWTPEWPNDDSKISTAPRENRKIEGGVV